MTSAMGGAMGVVWGQDRPAIGVGSDVSVGRSGRGLEARTGLKQAAVGVV